MESDFEVEQVSNPSSKPRAIATMIPLKSYLLIPFHDTIVLSNTPYSMNRLFSEFFMKFGLEFLEACETISGSLGEVFGGH